MYESRKSLSGMTVGPYAPFSVGCAPQTPPSVAVAGGTWA
eukprot:CAMPEP_0119134932 /NCGR_PEP_ID=MMETSP1310-20130426/18267_1 /TAXON_ID=464262 /ORGANISM="Genus nov. species nov., Strain RCC2339" /LENGTH=39 /DNA_ID= /DNA_START= /DNA_END= /DNA_ORIENTATION=